MSLCKTNTSDFSPAAYNGTSYSVREAVGINKNGSVKSYGGQTLDMTGNWNWKGNVGGKISRYDSIIKATAQRLNLDWRLCAALCWCESGFNPNAVSSAGAVGVMQLMPKTAEGLGVTDSYDPRQNILGGAKLISQLLDKYDGDKSLALAAYNAGSGNVSKYGGIPPFKETQNYVKKVLEKYSES